MVLGAPTVPSQAGNCSTPWANTLPRGKKPAAWFLGRLGRAALAGAGAQAASAQALSGAGYLLVSRRGLGRWQPGVPRLCCLDTVPSPDSSEVEVTTGARMLCPGVRSWLGWGGSRSQQSPSDTHHSSACLARPVGSLLLPNF